MRITGVEATIVRIPRIEAINDSAQDALIVQVHTDHPDIVGFGEVDSSPEVVKAIIEAPKSSRLCTGLAEAIVGQDPLEVERLWEVMYRASVWFGRRSVAIHACTSAVALAICGEPPASDTVTAASRISSALRRPCWTTRRQK